jgi:hypothetical protein
MVNADRCRKVLREWLASMRAPCHKFAQSARTRGGLYCRRRRSGALCPLMDRPPVTNSTPSRLLVGALGLLVAWLWFGNLGLRVLTDPDEGRYAEIPREMLATGDWLAPHLNGIQYLEKPPLQYWGTALLYQAAGIKPWVSRLYTAGLGFATLLLVAWAGRRFFGARAGAFGALILASSLLFYALGHINTLDMGLSFYLTAAAIAFALAQTTTASNPMRRRQMWLAWLCIGSPAEGPGRAGAARLRNRALCTGAARLEPAAQSASAERPRDRADRQWPMVVADVAPQSRFRRLVLRA